MSTLSELLKEVLSLSDPSNKKNKKKESKKKDKKTSSLLSKIKGEDEEVQIVEVEKEVIPVVLPISSQKTTKLLVFVDSLLPATNTITMQSNDSYDVISELWHYLSRELQASHRSTKTNHKMKLTEASSPTTAISPALAHKLRCMNLIDTLIHKYTSFRDIVQTNMSLISKSAGLMKNQNLSNEILAKGDYVDYVLERIALWDMLYGDEVEGFRMMKRYLVEVVKVKVPNLMVSFVCSLMPSVAYDV